MWLSINPITLSLLPVFPWEHDEYVWSDVYNSTCKLNNANENRMRTPNHPEFGHVFSAEAFICLEIHPYSFARLVTVWWVTQLLSLSDVCGPLSSTGVELLVGEKETFECIS